MQEYLNLPSQDKKTSTEIIKSLINELPLGGLAMLISGFDKESEKRTKKWQQDVAQAIFDLERKIENFNIDEMIKSDQFQSIFIEITQIAIKTHQEEKIKYLKNTLINGYLIDLEYDQKAAFIRILSQLTLTHLRILKFLNENEKMMWEADINIVFSYFQNFALTKEINDIEMFRYFLEELDNYRLVRSSTVWLQLEKIPLASQNTTVHSMNQSNKRHAGISKLGHTVLKLISDI